MAIQQGQFQDPRPLIQRLRRVDLWKICDFYKIDYDNSTEQCDSLIRKILSSGINIDQYVKFNGSGWPFVDLTIRQMPKEEKQIPAVEQQEPKEVLPPIEFHQEKPVKKVHKTYEEMKVFELRSLLKQRGVPFTRTEKKVSLIDKLNAYAASQVTRLG